MKSQCAIWNPAQWFCLLPVNAVRNMSDIAILILISTFFFNRNAQVILPPVETYLKHIHAFMDGNRLERLHNPLLYHFALVQGKNKSSRFLTRRVTVLKWISADSVFYHKQDPDGMCQTQLPTTAESKYVKITVWKLKIKTIFIWRW